MAPVVSINLVGSILKELMVTLPGLIYINSIPTTWLQENKLWYFLVHCLNYVPFAMITNKSFVSLYDYMCDKIIVLSFLSCLFKSFDFLWFPINSLIVYWIDDKEYHHVIDLISSNLAIFFKKKKRLKFSNLNNEVKWECFETKMNYNTRLITKIYIY